MATTAEIRLSMDFATSRFPKSINGRSKPHTSPTWTADSAAEAAPVSMNIFSKVGSALPSSRSIPITPRAPFINKTRPPRHVRGLTPPIIKKRAKPFSSTCVTIRPISSMCAEIIIRWPPSVLRPLRAIKLPKASVRTSSARPLI